ITAPLYRKAVDTFSAFAEARIALHLGRWDLAPTLVSRVVRTIDGGGPLYATYGLAAMAELALAAGLPAAVTGELIEAARAVSAAAEHGWAKACLARLDGRRGDPSALEASAREWQRIGARFELACTLHLIPERRDEAAAEFAALAVPPPAQR